MNGKKAKALRRAAMAFTGIAEEIQGTPAIKVGYSKTKGGTVVLTEGCFKSTYRKMKSGKLA